MGYSVKIFLPSPPNYVIRSPGSIFQVSFQQNCGGHGPQIGEFTASHHLCSYVQHSTIGCYKCYFWLCYGCGVISPSFIRHIKITSICSYVSVCTCHHRLQLIPPHTNISPVTATHVTSTSSGLDSSVCCSAFSDPVAVVPVSSHIRRQLLTFLLVSGKFSASVLMPRWYPCNHPPSTCSQPLNTHPLLMITLRPKSHMVGSPALLLLCLFQSCTSTFNLGFVKSRGPQCQWWYSQAHIFSTECYS